MSSMKSSWPEVLGKPAEAAKRKILADRPDVRVFVVPPGSSVTADFNEERVRIYVDYHNVVIKVPNIG